MASRDGGGIRAGLGGVDEDLKGLAAAVLVDGDEGLAQRGFDGDRCSPARERGRGFLVSLPDHELLGGGAASPVSGSTSAASAFFSAVAWVSSTTFSREPVT